MKSLFLLLTLSTPAFAGSTNCASPDGRLVYAFSRSDGGAQIGPSSSLTLDGETLISHSPFGGAEIHVAEFTLGRALWTKTYPPKDFYKVTKSVAPMTVKRNADGSVAYSDLVLCSVAVYVGPPRP